ncbi:transcriptional regulator BetI [Cognatishimia sp. MH4019]|uniref:transcriptional regulator BetI n=1 Tax=Cognatishimia sp. MH4019 TaxID=2854030 RepID=UPI001CD7CE99|nr:transcriptional regulator BetI [Cognatishimia sp. MH4019]
MPKLGMEPLRRLALVNAAITEIGSRGSLDVTVTQIAKRAGVSSALAHHYFGSKENILTAAMRRILAMLGDDLRAAQTGKETAIERLHAIVEASFSERNFRPDVIAAWLAFYVSAQTSNDAHRLLKVYHARLRSNLVHELRPLIGEHAPREAETIAAMIDGFYIRQALRTGSPNGPGAIAATTRYIDSLIAQSDLK